MTHRPACLIVATILGFFGCSGVAADPGTDALIRVQGGSWMRGPFPASSGGPEVLGAYLGQTRLRPGQRDKGYSGVTEAHATAVLVALEGDLGYFRVPVGLAPEVDRGLGFTANFSLSPSVEFGEHTLLTAAVDERGLVGAPLLVEFSVSSGTNPDDVLSVHLNWAGPADLDLHLVVPDGSEIFAGDPVYRVNGERLGALDFDSNADCVFDGRGAEVIAFSDFAPPGQYIVRVETRSLCGEESAPFQVKAFGEDGQVVNVEGIALPSDTRFSGGRGSGRTMASFDEP